MQEVDIAFILDPDTILIQKATTDGGCIANIIPQGIVAVIEDNIGEIVKTPVFFIHNNNDPIQEVEVTLLCEILGKELELKFIVASWTNQTILAEETMTLLRQN